tara:strand:+ start:10863 stop:11933 length:1071 start_codon:yes stop_codon:yes gene_type:complete
MKYLELSKKIKKLLENDIHFRKEFYKKNINEHFGNFENYESLTNVENFFNDYKARKHYTKKSFFKKHSLESDFFKNAIKFNYNQEKKYLTEKNINTLCKRLIKIKNDYPALYFIDKDFDIFINNFKLFFPYFFEKYILKYILIDMFTDFLWESKILVDINNIDTFYDLFTLECYYTYQSRFMNTIGDIFDDGINTFFKVLIGYTNNKTIISYEDGNFLINKFCDMTFDYFSNKSFKKVRKHCLGELSHNYHLKYKQNNKEFINFQLYFDNIFSKKHSLEEPYLFCADSVLLIGQDIKISTEEIKENLFHFPDSLYLILKEGNDYIAYYLDDEFTKGKMVIFDKYKTLTEAIDYLVN